MSCPDITIGWANSDPIPEEDDYIVRYYVGHVCQDFRGNQLVTPLPANYEAVYNHVLGLCENGGDLREYIKDNVIGKIYLILYFNQNFLGFLNAF